MSEKYLKFLIKTRWPSKSNVITIQLHFFFMLPTRATIPRLAGQLALYLFFYTSFANQLFQILSLWNASRELLLTKSFRNNSLTAKEKKQRKKRKLRHSVLKIDFQVCSTGIFILIKSTKLFQWITIQCYSCRFTYS